MRRYLQEVLPAEKSQRVERHLHHCPRCSSAIIDYIQTEEPQHHKQYTKKLKGILKTSQAEKKRVLSSFQVKAIRTTTAVVALLIFSFFALKTVINKQADYPLPSESLAVAEKSEKVAPVRHRSLKKATKATAETKEKPKKVAKVTKKTSVVPPTEAAPAKAPTVVTKARTTTAPESPAPDTAAPAQQKQAPSEPQPKVADVPTEIPASPAPQEAVSSGQEEVVETPVNETASRKPLPPIQKINATQSADAVAPLGASNPAEMPVPSNEILER